MNNRYIDVPFEKESIEETGKFTGYASAFGGKPDSYGDVIAYGAFSKSILSGGRNQNGVAMLWQHSTDQPIGIWEEMYEDNKGLKVQGQLAIGTTLGDDVFVLMKMGAIKGLSIGWDLQRNSKGEPEKDSFEVDEKTQVRTLKKIDLWEVSPVTFPAQIRARITGVKSIEQAQNERELEHALRDLGLSQKQSVYIVSLCKPGLRESGKTFEQDILSSINTAIKSESDRKEMYGILTTLKQANQAITRR